LILVPRSELFESIFLCAYGITKTVARDSASPHTSRGCNHLLLQDIYDVTVRPQTSVGCYTPRMLDAGCCYVFNSWLMLMLDDAAAICLVFHLLITVILHVDLSLSTHKSKQMPP
jgi:hypothetical protein